MATHIHSQAQSSLIVNYLPPALTDEDFRTMFLNIGPVRSAKIVRDKTTGFSYGFGFVEYKIANDAERAIQVLNGLLLDKKTIKVAMAGEGDKMKGGTNLYIRGLPHSYTKEDMDKLFSPFGVILQSTVMMNPQTGEGKGVGFVRFATHDDAEDAIKELHGKKPPGSNDALLVRYAEDTTSKQAKTQLGLAATNQFPMLPLPPPQLPGANNSMNSLPNTNFMPPALPPGLGTRYPSQSQSQYNTPPPRGPGPMRTNQSRFPHSTRYNPMSGSHATGATNNFNGPKPGLMQTPQPEGYPLFVYNLGTKTTEGELLSIFSPYGTVQKVSIMMDHVRNCSKGFGFVTMSNQSEAQKAIMNLNGFDFQGNGHALQVSFKNKNDEVPV